MKRHFWLNGGIFSISQVDTSLSDKWYCCRNFTSSIIIDDDHDHDDDNDDHDHDHDDNDDDDDE